uniref:Uncharacterized protein n=1 Tax=Vespula pensylvanica TaxID=30213 RepID=A0A834U576_VESPE|nr:hypothetical protein H0235_011501 [Vespula pensylvanica]
MIRPEYSIANNFALIGDAKMTMEIIFKRVIVIKDRKNLWDRKSKSMQFAFLAHLSRNKTFGRSGETRSIKIILTGVRHAPAMKILVTSSTEIGSFTDMPTSRKLLVFTSGTTGRSSFRTEGRKRVEGGTGGSRNIQDLDFSSFLKNLLFGI